MTENLRGISNFYPRRRKPAFSNVDNLSCSRSVLSFILLVPFVALSTIGVSLGFNTDYGRGKYPTTRS